MPAVCIPFPELAERIMKEKWSMERIRNYIEKQVEKCERNLFMDCSVWNVVFLEDILENPDLPIEIIKEEYREITKRFCEYVKSLKKQEVKKDEKGRNMC